MTCIGAFSCSEVWSKSTNQNAEYFPDISDETYLYIKLKVKNIGGDTVSDMVFKNLKLVFDDKYNYYPQQLDIYSALMSQFWSLNPLQEKEIWIVASIPDEIVNEGFLLSFDVGDTTFEFHGDSA